jgi:threonine/homoserine/homoserine lactone efflux protein
MFEALPLIVGVLLMQATPGPNMMAVSSIALGSGRRAGVSTAAGVATGVFVWAVLFTFGIGAVLSAFPQSVTAMKLVGGGYLLWLGVRALRAAWRGSPGGTAAAGVATTSPRAYLAGLLVVLTNPKAALMWVAISMFLAASGLSSAQFLVVGLCTSLSAMAVYGVYALLFSTGVAQRAYRRLFRGVEAVFGAVFGALGARLVSDGLRELRT